MQYKNKIEAMYMHLDEIQQLLANFGAEGRLRTIDVDLTLDKLRMVYDHMLALRAESMVVENVEEKPHKQVEPEIQIEDPVVLEKKEFKAEELIELHEEPEPELTAKVAKAAVITKQKAPEPELKSRTKEPSEMFLGDSIAKDKSILNDELSIKSNIDVSSRINTKPIKSIPAAIGINEKFELINNLFNGDSVRYEQAINRLDQAMDFNEAFEYLSSNFSWDMNDPLAQRILELVRRKLIVKKNE